MSIKVMSEVWDKSQHKANPLLTLLALADNANDDGYCWPGIEKIAQKTRVSPSTVMRCIKKLEDTAEVFAVHSRRHGNKYIVLVGKPDQSIEYALKKYFDFNAGKVQAILDMINILRVNCQTASNGSNCQVDTSDVAPVLDQNLHSCAISDVAPVQDDPSVNHQITVNTVAPKRKRSEKQLELDAMKNAFADAYGLDHDKVTHSQWSEFGRAGKELISVGASPEDVKPLHGYCVGLGWKDFSSIAMSKKYANYAKSKNGSAPPHASTTTAHDTRTQLGLVDA